METEFRQVKGKTLETKIGNDRHAGVKEIELTEIWQSRAFGAAKAAAGLRGYSTGTHVVLENPSEADAELWGLLVPEHQAMFATKGTDAKWVMVDQQAAGIRRVKVLRIMPWAPTLTAEDVEKWVVHGVNRVGMTVANVRVMGTTERAETAQVLGDGEIPTCIFVDGHGCEVVSADVASSSYWREKRAEREQRTAVVVPARFGVSSIEMESLAAEFAIEYMGTDVFMIPGTGQMVKGKNIVVRFKTRKNLLAFTNEVDSCLWVARYFCKVLPLRDEAAKFTAYCFKCGDAKHVAAECRRGAGRKRSPALPATERAEQLIAGTLPTHLKEATKRDILTAEALGRSVLPQNRLAYSIVAKMGVAVDVARRFPSAASSDHAVFTTPPAALMMTQLVPTEEVAALRAEVRELKELLHTALAGTRTSPDSVHSNGGGRMGIKAGLESMRRDMTALAAAVDRQVARTAQGSGGDGAKDAEQEMGRTLGEESSPASYVTTPRRRMEAVTSTPNVLRKRASQEVVYSPERMPGPGPLAIDDGRVASASATKRVRHGAEGKDAKGQFEFNPTAQRKGLSAGCLPALEMSDNMGVTLEAQAENLIEPNLIDAHPMKWVYGVGESICVVSYNL
ncbi:hypothetical protein HK101_001678 [Irineochytrium annulatum]|nr:hypothetical protein HK101_001678 [Irineochytrium annulatum]